MRALILALLLLTGGAGAQNANSPEARAAARELVEATGVRQQVDTMLTAMRGQMIAGIRRTTPSLSEAAIGALVDEFLMPEFRASSGEIAELAETQWASRLSAAELREIIAFYRTPAGQRMLQVQPQVAVEAMQFGQAWGTRVAEAAINKHRAALRARGLNL